MTAEPHVQERGCAAGIHVEMAGEFGFGRAAGHVFKAGIDEPEPDVVFRAGPTVSRDVEDERGIIVFVFGVTFVDAGGHAARFLEIERCARVPVGGRRHLAATIFINGHVIEHVGVQLGRVTRFADIEAGIAAFVRPDEIGVEPAFAATERVAHIHIKRGIG